jgi:hypothetical protein
MRYLACAALLVGLHGLEAGAQETSKLDPFEIQRRVTAVDNFDLVVLWQELGIPAELATVWPRVDASRRPSETPARFVLCDRCAGEAKREDLGAGLSSAVILRICENKYSGVCRFLFFDATGDAAKPWRLRGYADHDFGRHYSPTYELTAFGDQRFFVMKAEGDSGTGISFAYSRWFEILPRDVREVLTIPGSGHESLTSRSVDKAFNSTVTSSSSSAQGDELDVTFAVTYSANYFLVDQRVDEPLDLFKRVQHATYARPPGAREFVLVTSRSDVSVHEIQTVYTADEVKCSEFIQTNLEDLLQLARGRRGHVTEWIQRYAEGCEASPARTMLLSVLAGRTLQTSIRANLQRAAHDNVCFQRAVETTRTKYSSFYAALILRQRTANVERVAMSSAEGSSRLKQQFWQAKLGTPCERCWSSVYC